MKTYRELEIYKKHFLDMAADFIKTHIHLYGEYNRGDDLIEKILKDANELETKQEKIKELIEEIQDPIIKAILKEKIINGKKWNWIAERIGYSEGHIYRLYRKALNTQEVKKIMEYLQ